ncbi:MAG TPA: hypothetical protein VLD36_13880 [Burkholderiales bacterium]|jgi:hypothetical protein|nr:hypothetical protein [Burkholderiales bacterium]
MIRRLLTGLGTALLLAGCSAELDWRELHWEDGKLKVMLPGRPTKSEREVVLGGERMALHMLQAQKSGMAFGIAYAPLPAGDPGALLTAARDALLRNIDGKLLTEREVEVRGATGPAREFTGEGVVAGTPMVVAARVVAANGRFYEVVFVGRKDRAEEVDLPLYLGSLTLTP